ncbi:ArsR/SmtB family transcription factor [Cobetia sp. L2A1]|uniref:ArsR/SmtB family transcription factor n=1 Tax=Cobetia sp. L2A1 TaxID=2686360 RepID=UPI00131E25A1|nr:helix-turn-helix transcriptional regulator [Cobetia sp. L2A1]
MPSDPQATLETFAALSQATRLEAFRLLVRHEPSGLPAGDIARVLEVPHNTLSTHLGVLSRAGLIHSQRKGRSLIYRANLSHMLTTVQFLLRECCAGSPEVCDPLLASLTTPDCTSACTSQASQEPQDHD